MPSNTENLPVYCLNAFVYCTRRFYYEYVEGLSVVNDAVADGQIKHRRVDEGVGKTTAPDEETLQTRSFHLSSEKYGITGKIDVLEEKDSECYPVEYKKRACPRDQNDQPFVWDNDKIQLCAQALLLESNNYGNIAKGYLYYVGSKIRVEVVFDDTLRQKTIETIQSARALADSDKIPEPLKDDNRCIHCSLLPICLPEETGAIKLPPDPAKPIRRIIPEKSEGYVAYLNHQGARVTKKGENLVILDSKGEKLQELHLYHLEQIVVFGNISISTQALSCLLENNIPIVYLSIHGKFKGVTTGIPPKNISLRMAQYEAANNQALALAIARSITATKVHNQRVMLMRNAQNNTKQSGVPNNIGSEEAKYKLQHLISECVNAPALESLLGFEGTAARYYFGSFNEMLKRSDSPERSGIQSGLNGNGFTFSFEGRNKRPPSDPVNALLSFAYALLAKDCFSACLTVGLDPYLGFYHQTKYGRPALALDLMEEFRPIIADSVVLTLINNKMVSNNDFLINNGAKRSPDSHRGGACYLTESGRRSFFEAYERRRNDVVTHPVFGYQMSYGRVLETQARLLARVITGEAPEYIGFKVR
ncbi:MAG: CRISPR-associated endonuclease Cas1 [Planctomycetes bacterium]|nr:CRISPR-associated endonuclease Cas1 [Planctomycetota bacterium]